MFCFILYALVGLLHSAEDYTPPIIRKSGRARRVPNTLTIGVVSKGPECEHPVARYDEVEISWNLSLFTSHKFIDATNENESYIFRPGYNETIEGLENGVLGMCPGDVRNLYLPPSISYGLTGGEQDIPPFVSVALQVKLLDHYPRNYTPYYQRMVDKKAEYPEKNQSRYQRWLEDCEEAKKKGEKEPKFYPPYIQTPRYPYDYMKTELEDKGIEGYTPEEREEVRKEEETRRKMHDYDMNNRRRRETKVLDLTSKLKQKRRLLEIQRDKEINATRVLTAPIDDPDEKKGQDAEEDTTEAPAEPVKAPESPEMMEERKKIAAIEDKWNAIIKKQHALPLRLTKKQAQEVERRKEREQREQKKKERMANKQ